MSVNDMPVKLDTINENAVAIKMTGGTLLVGAYGLTLNEWVAVLTILYMVFQIGLLVPKYVVLITGIYNRWKKPDANGP